MLIIWPIENNSQWNDYIRSKTITNQLKLDEIQDDIGDVVVIHSYQETREDQGKVITDKGCVLTSKRLLLNLEFAIKQNPKGLDLAADGTGKIFRNRWVLIVIGFRYLKRSSDISNNYVGKEHYSHAFVPLCYGICTSESTEAYYQSFRCISLMQSNFFPTSSLIIHSVTMDMSYPIRNGAIQAFG